MYYLIFLILICGTVESTLGNLETVEDDALIDHIRNEKYLVVLFTKKDCGECMNIENELIGLREMLVEELDAWVVKVENSQMTRLYSSPAIEPVLVFFRHGIPLVYHGQPNEEEILHTFATNKEPISRELTDENFEHLTQAATGSTTGDWFIMFYTSDCIQCQRLQARWETVGSKVKTRTNLARINRATTGAATARRLNIYEVPTFVYFRHGSMYKYLSNSYTIDELSSFAKGGYRHSKATLVPSPKTPFDDLTAAIVVYFKDYPWLWQVVIGVLCIIILEILRRIFMASR